MCGRFTQKYTWQELADLYRLNQTARNIRPAAYNICPTDPVSVIIPGTSGLLLGRPIFNDLLFRGREPFYVAFDV
jgi:putative SOS response-associated peptidase YedK